MCIFWSFDLKSCYAYKQMYIFIHMYSNKYELVLRASAVDVDDAAAFLLLLKVFTPTDKQQLQLKVCCCQT